MANTTNFNWETPDDTDLVKDGAAAIRTLGSAIDTSLVDLKGGTTGQVLSKATNTDMDFTWVAQDDSNAIQNAIIDAKGDLIVGASNDTPARLAVGTNDYVLTADSTATNGVKWAALPASGSTFVGCSLRASSGSTQSITNNTITAINFNTEDFDTDGFHDNSTNNTRITIPAGKGGYYQVNALTRWATNSTGFRGLYIYKNDSAFSPQYMYFMPPSTVDFSPSFSSIIYLVATDYIELFVEQNSGGSLTNYTDNNRFSVGYLGA